VDLSQKQHFGPIQIMLHKEEPVEAAAPVVGAPA
jgi:hypothetical protein